MAATSATSQYNDIIFFYMISQSISYHDIVYDIDYDMNYDIIFQTYDIIVYIIPVHGLKKTVHAFDIIVKL